MKVYNDYNCSIYKHCTKVPLFSVYEGELKPEIRKTSKGIVHQNNDMLVYRPEWFDPLQAHVIRHKFNISCVIVLLVDRNYSQGVNSIMKL